MDLKVPMEAKGMRLDQFLVDRLAHLSRSRLQAMIRARFVTLNGKEARPGERLKFLDRISVIEMPPPQVTLEPEDIPLSILHEDDDLIVLNKPAGLVVHPAAGNVSGTLVNALLHHGELARGGSRERPGIVHRLDKETSGCLVVAKNDLAHQALTRQFAGRTVEKIYLALAEGIFPRAPIHLKTLIARHPVHRKKMAVVRRGEGREAVTDFSLVRQLPAGALVRCVLQTGRTHQIRVHLKHLGHPVLGDKLYGRAGAWPRQMLHAWKLSFAHPRSGERLEFTSPLPEDFIQAGAVP